MSGQRRYTFPMPERTHRPRLVLAAVGLAAIVGGVGAIGAVAAVAIADDAPPCEACQGFVTGELLTPPPSVQSSGGLLDTSITAQTRTVTIGGRRVSTQTYGPTFSGPTWVVSPGDNLRVLLRNHLPVGYLPFGQWSGKWLQPKGGVTNLHVHGLHVSPASPSDDIFLNVKSGQSYQYSYDLPATHRPGLYWYHPHMHRYVDMQTFAGMAGAIIVRGGLDNVPGIGNLRDRMVFIQNTEVRDGVTTASQYQVPSKRVITVNGQVQPRIDIQPGESQRLRIVNATTERFIQIEPAGGEYWILARDGNTLQRPVRSSLLQMAPGQRLEVLVRAPRTPGQYPLVQTYFNQRPTPFGKQPRVKIATLSVGGDAVTPTPVPQNLSTGENLSTREDLSTSEDLRTADVAVRRRVVFTQNPGIAAFYVNGKQFAAHGKVSLLFRPKVNTTEEWLIKNQSPEWHNFHIHINPYQVVARDGKPVRGQPYWADSVGIAPGRSVTIRQRFADFTGEFVFHCHVLVHEDHGMMAAIEVRP